MLSVDATLLALLSFALHTLVLLRNRTAKKSNHLRHQKRINRTCVNTWDMAPIARWSKLSLQTMSFIHTPLIKASEIVARQITKKSMY
jgi:hypothetical protein